MRGEARVVLRFSQHYISRINLSSDAFSRDLAGWPTIQGNNFFAVLPGATLLSCWPLLFGWASKNFPTMKHEESLYDFSKELRV